MGLGVTVGALTDLLEHDPESAVWMRQEMDAVNLALRDAWAGEHEEPVQSQVWSGDGYGYSGLHALRELAGLIWLGRELPRDVMLNGQQVAAEQALSDAYVQYLEPEPQVGWLGRMLGKSVAKRKRPPFAHLVLHSDTAGYYIPLAFPDPVMPNKLDGETDDIWPVGSVPQLQAELLELAQVLGLPDDMSKDDDELAELLDAQSPVVEGALWRAQPIAAHSLLLLREACAHSLSTGAAIRFE